MVKMGMNLQDSFLNQVRKENTEIRLVLLDGTSLNGHVRGFDNFTVILSARGSQHLIYKHAIAQIISRRMHDTGDLREFGIADGAPQGGPTPVEQPQPVQDIPAGPVPVPVPVHEAPRDARGDETRPRGDDPRQRGNDGRGRGEEFRGRGGEQRGRGHDDAQPREDRRPKNGGDDQRNKANKFNSIDFSSLKMEKDPNQP